MQNQYSPRVHFEVKLEALRGFAAVVVVLCHALYLIGSLDPVYVPSKAWEKLFPGHSCVLLFFVLSGYVIGLTNKRPIQGGEILVYLKKRFTRLYPIYLISLFITLAVIGTKYSLFTILGHFVFLQNGVVPVIYENNPLWSLNSEVFYYLLFIPISFFSFNASLLCVASLLVGLAGTAVFHSAVLSSYGFGLTFWAAGLWAARLQNLKSSQTSNYLLLAYLLLFIGYQELNPFIPILSVIEGKLNSIELTGLGPAVVLSDLAQLPLCLYIILKFTNKKILKDELIAGGLFALSWVFFLYSFNKHGLDSAVIEKKLLPAAFLAAGTIAFAASLLLRNSKSYAALPRVTIQLGSISYAIYAIHFPISLMLAKITFFSGTLFTFCIRLLIDLVIVFALSYLLERRLQPWIKARVQ